MKLRYTIKIKDEHNPPEFKKGMGKGVVATQDVVYKTIETEEQLKDPSFQHHVFNFSQELLEQWFEVTAEVIDIKKERKEKIENINNNLDEI